MGKMSLTHLSAMQFLELSDIDLMNIGPRLATVRERQRGKASCDHYKYLKMG